eukprot:TRINITY_DN249_c0_g1_i12.p1 TRINITY_DN249_c0_g1~~TRINITY_DN249_c0_g1_i12.p1  ORF type:complete len:765 (-),score=136.42 TRINITY_DN249_c0_g1_i12:2175-4469(-)
MSSVTAVTLIYMVLACQVGAKQEFQDTYQQGLLSENGRRLLQTSFVDLVQLGDQVNGALAILQYSQDAANAAPLADVLAIIAENGLAAYTLSSIFADAIAQQPEVVSFLSQVILAAEQSHPSELAELWVAAISQGEYQTEAMASIIAEAVAVAGCDGLQNTITQAYTFAQSQGKARDLEETLYNSGEASECLLCIDYRPTTDVSCAERQLWGECEEEWMQFGYHCAKTCGFCLSQTSVRQELKAATPTRPSISVFAIYTDDRAVPGEDEESVSAAPVDPVVQQTAVEVLPTEEVTAPVAAVLPTEEVIAPVQPGALESSVEPPQVAIVPEEEPTVGIPPADNLAQAILSSSPLLASQEIQNMLASTLSQDVLTGLVQAVNSPNAVIPTSKVVQEMIRSDVLQDEFFQVLYASMMPAAGGDNMIAATAQGLVLAAQKKNGAEPAANMLLKFLETGDEAVIEPLLQQIAELAGESCKGIEALSQALMEADAASSTRLLDYTEVATCQSQDSALLPMEEPEAAAPVLATSDIPAPAPVTVVGPMPASIDQSRPLQTIGYIDLNEAARLVLNEATRYVFTADSSIFVGDLRAVAERGQMAELAQAIAVAMQTAIESNDVGASYSLTLALPELVAFSGGEVAVSVAAALGLVHDRYGCDGVDDYIKSVTVKTKELEPTDGGSSAAIWGAALNQQTSMTECLGDSVRTCTGFALRDCCQVGDFPEACNFCGFQFAKQCRFRKHESSIPATNYYVYEDKSFDGILCKCPVE